VRPGASCVGACDFTTSASFACVFESGTFVGLRPFFPWNSSTAAFVLSWFVPSIGPGSVLIFFPSKSRRRSACASDCATQIGSSTVIDPIVCGPILPSTSSEKSVWYALSAACVFGSLMSSLLPGSLSIHLAA